MSEQNLTRLTQVINIGNIFPFVHFIEKLSSDPVKFDSNADICEELIETITVHENRCSYALF